MKDATEAVTLTQISGGKKTTTRDIVTRELPVTILLNNTELATLLCSPDRLDYLAAGFLSSEGFIASRKDIKKLLVDRRLGIVRVETVNTEPARDNVFKRFIASGCGRGASFYSAADAALPKIESQLTIDAAVIPGLMKDFQHRSAAYRATGGVHSAALAGPEGILLFAEDIGRHSAIDKIFGQCLLEEIPTADRLVITSGRITSEILLKVARRAIPVVISRSAPTDLALKLAGTIGITLIGFARGERMNIYTHDLRVTDQSEPGV